MIFRVIMQEYIKEIKYPSSSRNRRCLEEQISLLSNELPETITFIKDKMVFRGLHIFRSERHRAQFMLEFRNLYFDDRFSLPVVMLGLDNSLDFINSLNLLLLKYTNIELSPKLYDFYVSEFPIDFAAKILEDLIFYIEFVNLRRDFIESEKARGTKVISRKAPNKVRYLF